MALRSEPMITYVTNYTSNSSHNSKDVCPFDIWFSPHKYSNICITNKENTEEDYGISHKTFSSSYSYYKIILLTPYRNQ